MKKNNLLPFFVICFFTLLVSVPSFAQNKSKKYYENKKKVLQKEIRYTNELLGETKKNKRHSLNQLVTLNKKISVREELISTINFELRILNRQIKRKDIAINVLQAELVKLKDEYAKMIYYAYKNQDAYSRLMFIFAAKDFQQAYMRLKYLQQYSDYRHRQAELITQKKAELNESILELEAKKVDKRSLLTSEQSEKKNLSVEKTEKERIFSKLQVKEGKLKKDLKKKRAAARKFQQAILRVIQKELEKAQQEANKGGKKKPLKLVLTPEAQKLSNSFASNKHKLPWPVVKGIISERFGVHPHPLMPNININNNGIDITTNKGALARAVFDGEVKAIVNMPGSGKFILIRHGEYLTIYSNLNEIYIKVGDKVKTKQQIASIIYDDEGATTVLHFELWKGQVKYNPEHWLFKSN